MGVHVPLLLLKSVQFLEALTAMLSSDARTRPVYEPSSKLNDGTLFVLENTELFGLVQVITTLLLTFAEPFKVSQNTTAQGTLP